MSNGLPSASPLLYIAGTGMITAIGPSASMTFAATCAGKSGYQISNYLSKNNKPITMSLVPATVFEALDYELEECNPYNAQYDHVIKMAIYALTDACQGYSIEGPLPLILAMPEPDLGPTVDHGLLIRNLITHCAPAVSSALTRTFHSGRAAGMDAIDFAFQYLLNNSLLLVGGSDSYINLKRIKKLDEANRLKTIESPQSFAPGEGACFLLLTPNPELALVRNEHIIALHRPGLANESGHMYSETPYRGEGLDEAFKKALIGQPEHSIQAIYSSMNGENFWAKEYGVAYLRNKSKFVDPVRTEHPADCYGDLGSATTMALIAMAAENLWKNKQQYKHLVYSSSDTEKRGALVIEKIKLSQ
ncbi:MAG: hypothetical protein B0W54_23690 [Cellvibrio sp. 79]|nr:MAG: hypothetical protein B0W54_23690 [Cellvibrio sp. 79]